MYQKLIYFKIQGEEALRNAYRHEGLAYYIVRPGGLNDNLGGILGLTIEQGTFSSLLEACFSEHMTLWASISPCNKHEIFE